ncbi:NAD(+) diphosphatase [Neptunicella sp. SCSIO 80796]|uniref:NAD(+) diphosphatase n=1 Tax=Neptunicella plasticusilytica TaxID=3117012 RepID=UPI003A4E27CD
MINQNVQLHIKQQAWWLVFSGNQLLQLDTHPGLPKNTHAEMDFLGEYFDQVIQVGEYQQLPCYMIDIGSEVAEQQAGEFNTLRDLLVRSDQELFQIAARAWQVALFLRTHRYCGQCGSTTQKIDWELAVQCPTCQHRCYPRISPCIIVAIRHQDKILLAQGRHHKNNMYSTLAGFVESGESLEQAVHREVMEEVGIEIKNLRYFNSQPWPFPHSLMMGYLAEYKSGEIKVDGHEIIRADWFAFDSLPLIPPTFSIAGQLIQATIDQ